MKKYKLKPSLRITFDQKKNLVKIGNTYPLGIEINISNVKFLSILKQLNGENKVSTISKTLKTSTEEVSEVIEFLLENNLIEEAKEPHFHRNCKFDDRLNNFIKIFPPTLDYNSEELLYSLSQKTVTFIGCGAIGTHVIQNLLGSGIKKFIIIDNDVVEESNLSRQCLYDFSQVGMYKVDAAEDRIKKIYPKVEVKKIKKYVRKYDDLTNEMFNTDFLVLSADTPANLVQIVNRKCIEANLPFINLGFYETSLVIGPIVLPRKSACYQCIFSQDDNSIDLNEFINQIENYEYVWEQSIHPSLVSLASSIAAFEIFRFLSIGKSKLVGSTLTIRIFDYRIDWTPFEKKENCRECGIYDI